MEKRWKAFICLIVLIAVVYGGFVAVYSVSQRDCREVAYSSGDYRQIINEYRKARGLPLVEFDDQLDREAERTARWNARNGSCIHPQLGGSGAAEIVAYNYSGWSEAVDQWHKSAGHRAIMSSPRYRYCGCSCVKKDGRFYCCARFR